MVYFQSGMDLIPYSSAFPAAEQFIDTKQFPPTWFRREKTSNNCRSCFLKVYSLSSLDLSPIVIAKQAAIAEFRSG